MAPSVEYVPVLCHPRKLIEKQYLPENQLTNRISRWKTLKTRQWLRNSAAWVRVSDVQPVKFPFLSQNGV